MIFLDDYHVSKHLSFEALIPELKNGFSSAIKAPERHHHNYNQNHTSPSTLLLMPAWQDDDFLGVKLVTVSPENGNQNLPVIHGLYILFDAKNGKPILSMDARALTAKRTAATSALASSFLSKKDSSVLLMVGTGALARQLIPAHILVRPIKHVLVWGRDSERVSKFIDDLDLSEIKIEPCSDIKAGVESADIISCATVSKDPVIFGNWLQPGQHFDLVGSYRPDMREADDEAIRNSSIYVDSRLTAPKESGDLVIPIKNGILKAEDIQSDLFELCKANSYGRKSDQEITCFKSVGHALEDFVAAKIIHNKLM